MSNMKLHMRFQLTPRSMTLVELELYKFEFFREFLGISQISDATSVQQQRCKHVELAQFLACFRDAQVCQRHCG